MATRKRIRDNTQRGMHKRMIRGKKPMTTEQKETQKKAREAQRELTKSLLEAERAATAKKAE
ncbi:MAG: hypothetical protein PF542_05135 [Nanoarchaeota archaeon]|jgi:hypothetical protein|nr:hypothetical protein [Nanoarchaeota archaeon]